MSESSGEIDPSVFSGTKDQPRSLEYYIPPGYPSILFQVTSLDNSERIKKSGLETFRLFGSRCFGILYAFKGL